METTTEARPSVKRKRSKKKSKKKKKQGAKTSHEKRDEIGDVSQEAVRRPPTRHAVDDAEEKEARTSTRKKASSSASEKNPDSSHKPRSRKHSEESDRREKLQKKKSKKDVVLNVETKRSKPSSSLKSPPPLAEIQSRRYPPNVHPSARLALDETVPQTGVTHNEDTSSALIFPPREDEEDNPRPTPGAFAQPGFGAVESDDIGGGSIFGVTPTTSGALEPFVDEEDNDESGFDAENTLISATLVVEDDQQERNRILASSGNISVNQDHLRVPPTLGATFLYADQQQQRERRDIRQRLLAVMNLQRWACTLLLVLCAALLATILALVLSSSSSGNSGNDVVAATAQPQQATPPTMAPSVAPPTRKPTIRTFTPNSPPTAHVFPTRSPRPTDAPTVSKSPTVKPSRRNT